ncbi:MAG: rod shape-determining protein MreC [Methylotenera sp.]
MARGFNHKLEQQQAPAFFVRGPSAFARLVFFSALSLALMAIDSRLQYMTGLRQNLVVLLHPLQVLANAPSQFYRDTDEYFSTHHRLLNENQQLKQQALKQDIALQRLNTLSLENEHLRHLFQADKTLVETSVLGEIMHEGRDPFTKKIIVNRGESHQIVAGEAVVDATGVIGQVTRTYTSSSEVTLITDKSLAIPIQVERNGLRAIAFGHGRDNTLDLPYLPSNVDIRRGDTLVTSGIDGIYPAGLAVATVSQIEISPDSPFARIICVPTGGVENHRQVLLVKLPPAAVLPEDTVTNLAAPSNPATDQPKKDATQKLPQKTPEKTPEKTLEIITEKQQPDNTSNPNAPE